ncbi:coiled-coil domain-containing protein [Amycolatopsis aidingensis]|uniref:hypothetical protein n=1 Tax=Amycolatopsis aidingensis TaxID=2842453 RepID=UPI001C0B25C5|nr:hypothetical protein [Amycolatopsis aidingensis]
MADETVEYDEGEGDADLALPMEAPPIRRGSRDERREATLRALAAGQEARCAYCGRSLPPLPSRGGRPTPYCAADPDRYGKWGAKVISCAMLDEQREIWLTVYGPDQPMTRIDTQVLDERLGSLLGTLDPVRAEVAALREQASTETAAALTAKDEAEQARQRAQEEAEDAVAERDRALAEAERTREQAESDRAEREAAQQAAEQAGRDREQALSDRQAAQQDRDRAEADRQRALDQAAAAQDRIAELQTSLAGERAATLERIDQLRRAEEQERGQLRAALEEEHRQQLRARTAEFDEQLRAAQAAADQRITELTGRLTEATRHYADTLGPLHERIAALERELAARSSAETALSRRFEQVHAAVTQALADTTEDQPLRERVAAALEPGEQV